MKISIQLVSSIVLIIAAVGCNSKNDGNKPVIEPAVIELATNGVWNTPEYGYIFDVNEDNVQMYQYTENFCQTFDLGINSDDFISSMQVSEDKTSAISTVGGLKVPGLTVTKQSNLPDNCGADLVANISENNYVYDPERDFEIFWQTFKQHYAFFGLEGIDWNEIYQIASNQVNQDTSEEDLFEILTAMVSPLKDFHVQLENETLDDDFSTSRKQELSDKALAYFLEDNELTFPLNQEQVNSFDEFLSDKIELSQKIITDHLTEVKFNKQETIFWGVTEDNIGYINILTMELSELIDLNDNIKGGRNELLKIIDLFMADLIDTKGIVVDVRYNEGGFDFIGHMLISRWINKDLHAYTKQARLGDSRTPLVDFIIEPQGNTPFLGPIALLTSTSTSSAAETFAMAVRERENTVLIGEATGGGLSDTLLKFLPHGTVFTLSNEFYLTPNRESFEGVGVPVSVEQNFFTQKQLELEQDFGLEKALSWVLLQADNP